MKNTIQSYDFLFVENPNSKLIKNFEIKIHPLGPLSMTSGQPMDFRKSDIIPTTKMLYGMIENLIKFHLNSEQRSVINKQLKKFYGDTYNLLFQTSNNDKKFFPIIQHLLYFELVNDQKSLIDNAQLFNDYASTMNERLTKGKELKSHFNGSRIHDKELLANYKKLKENFDFLSEEEYKEINDKTTRFYTKPVNRQYVILHEDIVLKCRCTEELYQLIKKNNLSNKSLYLGHSESLVEVEVQ